MPDVMTQVKFTIESGIVSCFKARCADEGVSMASVIRQCMKASRPVREVKANTLTRPQRRKAVLKIIDMLNCIMNAESDYRDSIPEQFTQRYEDADQACESLMEAIACLEDAF
jgi:hypothetical protein